MKKLAILVSISLVVGIPLLHGYENLNRIKIEEVSTTTESSNQSSESDQSNWEEELEQERLEKQERLERDIRIVVTQIYIGMDGEVSKEMIVDCLADDYDRELVSEVIDSLDIDWKYNCKKTFKGLLNEGSDPDRIPLMLKELQFTDEEIQYAIDNH